jgi:hypothetical protein
MAKYTFAQFVAHAPCAFIGHACLPLHLLGRDPMAGAGHQIHREKPMGEFRAALVKDGASSRINMVPALLAGIGPALSHRVEFSPQRATAGACDFGAAVVDLHQLGEAGRVVRIFGLELFEGVFGHGLSPTCDCGIAYPNPYLLSRDNSGRGVLAPFHKSRE